MRVSEALFYLKGLDPREPVFILRGQDRLASGTLIEWIHRAEDAGVSPEKIEGALGVLAQILFWQKKKLPD